MTGDVTTRVQSGQQPKNGPTGKGQTQWGAGEDAVATGTSTTDKGGMRGLGLLAIVIAEIALKKQSIDLAKDYYKTNKKDYDFFKAVHQGPIQQTVTEAMSLVTNPKYNHDYYASAPAGMAKAGILDKQWFEARRRVHRYSTGLQKRIDYDFAVTRLHGLMGGWNLARRYEMTYADEHNNRRFDRMIEVSNIGIGVGNIVRQGLASSVANLSSAYDGIGDTIATIGNGLAANTGYRAGRTYAANEYSGKTTGTANSSGPQKLRMGTGPE